MQVLYNSEFDKGWETIDIDLKISHKHKERNLYKLRLCIYFTLWFMNIHYPWVLVFGIYHKKFTCSAYQWYWINKRICQRPWCLARVWFDTSINSFKNLTFKIIEFLSGWTFPWPFSLSVSIRPQGFNKITTHTLYTWIQIRGDHLKL